MKGPGVLEGGIGKLKQLRIGMRPWRILLLMGIMAIAFITALAFSLNRNYQRSTDLSHQRMAAQRIQNLASEQLLALEDPSLPLSRREIRLNRFDAMDRLARVLLEGGEVAGIEFSPLDDPALRDSVFVLAEAIQEFRHGQDEYRRLIAEEPGSAAFRKILYRGYEDVGHAARAVQKGLRPYRRQSMQSFRAIQYFLVGFAGIMLVTIGVLLSRKANRRLHDVLGIRRTLERYDMVFEKSPLAYQSLDHEARLLVVNQVWLDILGYTREEVVGTWLGDYIQPEAKEFFKEHFERFKKEDQANSVVIPMLHRDGRLLLVSFDGKIERDDQGQFIRTHCIMKDVTEQHAAQQVLRAREAQRAVVVELGREALDCTKLDPLFDKAVHAVADTLKVDFCKVLELEPDGKKFLLRAGVGWDDGLVGHATVPFGKDSQAGYTLLREEPVIVGDLSRETRFHGPDLLIDHGVVSGMSVIIGSSRKPFGIFSAHTLQKRIFTGDDTNFLLSVAHLIDSAIKRLDREGRLRDSEALLRTFIDTAEDPIFIKDKNFRYTLVNLAMAELFALPTGEILGKKDADLFGEKAAKSIQSADRLVLAGETVRVVDSNPLKGEIHNFNVVKVPMRDAEGKITGICGIARDISDSVETARALAQSEARFRTLIDAAEDVIFLKDTEQRFSLVNPAQAKVVGLPTSGILGKTSRELFGDEFGDAIELVENRVLAGEIVRSEHDRRVDGNLRHFSVVRVPTRNLSGEVTGICGIARDVTEYRAVKEEILQLATAIEQAGEVVVITDREGIIHYVNPAFERVTGYTREEAIGQNPRILKSGAHDEQFYKELWGTLLDGKVWTGHFINKRKDGSIFHENASVSPVFDQSGEIVNFVSAKHDITRQMEMEEQVRHAERMEAVGHLAGGLAHDFNNILQSMTGFLEFAQEGLDPESQRNKDLEEVRKGAARAITLTQELLTFSHMREVHLEPLDLGEAMRSVLEMLRPMLSNNIYVDYTKPVEPVLTMADTLQLERVIMNLLVNARDAMPEGGELSIELEKMQVSEEFASVHPEVSVGPHVCFCIEDTGVGISPKRLGQIFDPFYSTKDIAEGTGLGLAVAHGIIKQHGGLIEVESEPGKWTRFRVILPEAPSRAPNEEEPAKQTLQ